MLSKLLKHEFRATGRKMLPSLGVLALLGLLASLSIRGLEADIGSDPLRIAMILLIVAFAIAVTVIWIVTLVQMIVRFYSNLLKEEGYLSFTLPASIHELVWAKLIVATVWFFVTALLIVVLTALAIIIGGRMNFDDLKAAFEGIDMVLEVMRGEGVTGGILTLFCAEIILSSVCVCLTTCLHFYAAMSLGQMSDNHKALWSVLAFIGISIAFSIAANLILKGFAALGVTPRSIDDLFETISTMPDTFHLMNRSMGFMMLGNLVQSAVLYLITVFSLQRRLNLA